MEINFKVSKWDLDPKIGDNAARLDSIDRRFTTLFGDSIFALRHVRFIGSASPEGSVAFNEFLSKKRADTLFDYLSKYRRLVEADKEFSFLGRDWEGVLILARVDSDLPYRAETVSLLESIVNEKRMTGKEPARSLERIKSLRDGVPYRYLLHKIFPKVRSSKVVMFYDKVLNEQIIVPEPAEVVDSVVVDTVELVEVEEIVSVSPARIQKPFYMDIRTNMLMDVIAIPNIGVDFYLGKNFTI